MYRYFKHGDLLQKWGEKIEKKIAPVIQGIEKRVDHHQFRLLSSYRQSKVTETHLSSSTGYGYQDSGREVLEQIVAAVFEAEASLFRPQIISGTHAIVSCLFGVLRPGDSFLYLTGAPYDTLQQAIGLKKDGTGTLIDFGISYQVVPLTPEGKINWDTFDRLVTPQTKCICIQRSRGYSDRHSFTIAEIEAMIKRIRQLTWDVVVFVDNCYGEFVEEKEPTHVGADLMAGSLIKNPGGGLAKSGGYICGKKEWLNKVAARLYAPGILAEGGATFGYLRDYFQGFFLAPHVVGEALKGAVFAAALLEEAGFYSTPRWDDNRTDIIQLIRLQNRESLLLFCQGIQEASPIDAHVCPVPSLMPGYQDEVIMAAGTFVQGATIELTADGPLRPPFNAYLQGGLTYSHVKIAILSALDKIL